MRAWWERDVNSVEDALYVLREARTFRGDSAEAFSRMLGVSKKTLLSWERGSVKSKKITPYAKDCIISYVREATRKKRALEEGRDA